MLFLDDMHGSKRNEENTQDVAETEDVSQTSFVTVELNN